MPDLEAIAGQLRVINNKVGRRVDLIGALSEDPALVMTIDGASTITLTCSDPHREIINSGGINDRSWVVVAGIYFEFVNLSKNGDYLSLTFEDAIVAALRRRTKRLVVPGGKTTRREFAIRLAREARVPHLIDPTHRGKVKNPLTRSTDGQTTNSWEVLGSDVAEPINWRRFSDGKQLVMGSDEWLTSGYKKPAVLKENTDGVGSIDFDLDVAKRASTAKVTIDTRLLDFAPGTPCRIAGLGPAGGLWIVQGFNRTLTRTRGELNLTRRRHELDEPKKERGASGDNDRDSGEPDGLPGQEGNDDGGRAGNAARERMVAFALAQRGKPYEWGASGPGAYDCSGLVQAATAAAGKVLGKPSASQWSTCVAQGKTISVSAALGIRGALLFRIGGEYNHVAISLGNGSTMEAMGSAYGCLIAGNAASRGWTGAALWL